MPSEQYEPSAHALFVHAPNAQAITPFEQDEPSVQAPPTHAEPSVQATTPTEHADPSVH